MQEREREARFGETLLLGVKYVESALFLLFSSNLESHSTGHLLLAMRGLLRARGTCIIKGLRCAGLPAERES